MGGNARRLVKLLPTPEMLLQRFGELSHSRLSRSPDAIAKYVPNQPDREIIAYLRNDGRAAPSSLSETLGIARGTQQKRLDRLVEGVSDSETSLISSSM